jgi:hypothetical protein
MKNIRLLFLLAILILATGIFFWPTIYRYDKVGERLLRTNRLTGKTQEYSLGSWTSYESKSREPEKLPYEERKKVTGKASINESLGRFTAEIYNGSSYNIQRFVFNITLKEKDGTIRWERRFEGMPLILMPLSSGNVNISISDCKNYGNFEWRIDEIYGYKIK